MGGHCVQLPISHVKQLSNGSISVDTIMGLVDSLLQQELLIGSLPVQLLRLGVQFSGVVGVVSLQAAHLLLLCLISCSLLSSCLSACLHQPATWSMQSASSGPVR